MTSISKIWTVVVLAIFILGGILVWEYWFFKQEEAKVSKEKEEEIKLSQELTAEMIEKNVGEIINKVLPLNFDRKNAEYLIDDLNNDGWLEIIVTACLPTTKAQYYEKAYLGVLKVLNKEGDYQKIGELEFGEPVTIFRAIPKVAELDDLESLQDIDGDGQKEIILYLGAGGASNEAYGIFDLDWSKQEINWLNMRYESGAVQPTFLLRGGSVMHQETFQLNDIDGDGRLEIIEKNGGFIGSSLVEEEDWLKEENWQWQKKVYRWDEGVFSYDKELTEQLD